MMRRILVITLFLAQALTVAAQVDANLEQAAETYFSSHPEERLYVHLAKSEILAGEQLWFRVFHYSPDDNQPFAFSKVAYVELINAEGENVAGERILMDEAGGGGYLAIPAVIDAGNYYLKAYTRWMQNFDSKAFFTAPVKVINTFKALGLKSPPDSARVQVTFTPEGGDLVAGNRAQVGILMLDGQGRGISMNGSVLSRDSVKVASLETDSFGMGLFSFTPEEGQSYQAVFAIDSTTEKRYPLPVVRPTGLSILTEKTNSGYQVKVMEKGVVPGRRYLAGISRGTFLFVKSASSGDAPVEFVVDNDELKEGINQLTVFTNEGVPVCERLIYKEPTDNLDVTLEVTRESFGTREEVEVRIQTKNSNGDPVDADLSLSVFPQSEYADYNPLDFSSYLWLTSELDLPQALVNECRDGEMTLSDISKMLLIYGWRRYDWQAIQNTRNSPIFTPELRGPVLSGKVLDTENTEGIVYFGYADSLSNIFAAPTASDGSFTMETPNYYGKKDIILRYDQPEIPGIRVTPVFHSDHHVPVSKHFEVNPSYKEQLLRQSENLQVENIFQAASGQVVSNFENFYGEASISYLLDEYTRFPVMEEVMREYVYGAFVRKRKDTFYFRILDEDRNKTMDDDPLILLDGIPVFSADEIMQLDPLRIRKIDVYRGKYGIGPVMANGVVAFYSYTSDMAGYELPANSLKESYQGLQRFKQFLSPDYSDSGVSKRIPDFRTQLFWEPNIITSNGEARLRFFTSDLKGNYKINVQGLGSHGYPGSASGNLEVD